MDLSDRAAASDAVQVYRRIPDDVAAVAFTMRVKPNAEGLVGQNARGWLEVALQRGAMVPIHWAAVTGDKTVLDTHWSTAETAFAHQRSDGGFAYAPVIDGKVRKPIGEPTSDAFFISEVSDACLLLEEGPLSGASRRIVDTARVKIRDAVEFLARPSSLSAMRRVDALATNRCALERTDGRAGCPSRQLAAPLGLARHVPLRCRRYGVLPLDSTGGVLYSGSGPRFVAHFACGGANVIRWFARECWPRIKRSLPDACLRIVGKGSDGALKLAGSDIDGLGWVANIADEIATWSLMVIPLIVGAGTRVKLAQAFSLKCPVVSTSLGAYGYDLRNGVEVALADSPEAFAADACVRMAQQPVEAEQMATKAWERFLKNWTWEAITPRIWAAAESCLRVNASRG